MYQEPYTDYSAIQGPCPSGFHVPTKAQWEEVYNAWTTLGGGNSDATNFGIALKLPFAGYRDYDMTVRVVGSTGHYWTCEARSNSPTTSWVLNFSSSGSGSIAFGSYYRAPANSIRAFKDVSVEPTESWTKMYGTSIESGGIFWDSVNGLISISGDGSNWITIADKNLGATTVWSGGDTLTDANCGYFYQWGNNYGFAHSGAVSYSYTKVDASNYGPGNYYNDSTFRYINSEPNNWDSSNNLDIWGGETGAITVGGDIEPKKIYVYQEPYSRITDMRGPCDEGFHIPLRDERQTIIDVGVSIGAWTTSNGNIITYLKLPCGGNRMYSNGSINAQGTYGYYWCSNKGETSTRGSQLFFSSSQCRVADATRCSGQSIRPFKDSAINPIDNGSTLKSGWTWLYHSGSNSYGIAHNSSEKLISLSSNGTTRYTIADKNLGATTVYNNGDTLSQNNCGKYYQRGNNYGFAWTGTPATSSTQVNASTYGPGNYYSSSTFRTQSAEPYDWSSVQNDNLWGGETGPTTGGGDTEVQKVYVRRPSYISYAAMQGPCPDGFHIPTSTERNSIKTELGNLGISIANGLGFKTYLKMPFSGFVWFNNATISSLNTQGNYRCADKYSNTQSFNLLISESSLNTSAGRRGDGELIRPFKDVSVAPDSSWTELYTNGIYHSSTLGLISIKNGTDRITIADKNLGATTVYNDGDTLSEANAGKYYQWGNNYGFPFTGPTTTSSTQVNASTYGPGNYYNSSTFITGNSAVWDSSNNNDLRGGVTGPISGGGDIQIRPALKYVDFLLVGGGGGGGYSTSNCQYKPGAGGGGGGAIYCEGYAISSGEYCITIGAGGYRDNGTSSIFGDFEATGGCCGRTNGTAGCSGYVTYKGDTIVNYTSGGGRWTNGSLWSAGGGGGIGGNGCPGVSYYVGGAGGLGCLANTSWGEVLCVGGGGGGYGYGGSGAGCYGGGSGSTNGGDATSYTGGGGGGAYRCSNSGGIGAGGVFYLGYPSSCGYLVTGGNCCYECNGYCIHKFTSSGTLTVN